MCVCVCWCEGMFVDMGGLEYSCTLLFVSKSVLVLVLYCFVLVYILCLWCIHVWTSKYFEVFPH